MRTKPQPTSDKAHPVQVPIMLTPAERKLADTLADELGLRGVGALFRLLLRQQARQLGLPTPPEPPRRRPGPKPREMSQA